MSAGPMTDLVGVSDAGDVQRPIASVFADAGPAIPLTQPGSTQIDRINLLGLSTDVVRLKGRFTAGGICSHVGMNEALIEARYSNKRVIVDTDVLAGGQVGINNITSLEIIAEHYSKIIAQPGFPGGVKALRLEVPGTTGRLAVRGLFVDTRQMPLSQPGQSNDGIAFFGLTSEALVIEECEIYAGDDWLAGGGDSGMFVSGWKSIHFKGRNRFRGCRDAGVYASGTSVGDGTSVIQENLQFDKLEFDGCLTGFVTKRRGIRISGHSIIGRNTGSLFAAGGEADVQTGIIIQADDVDVTTIEGVNCNTGAIFRFCRNGHIGSIIMRDIGAYIAPKTPGDASTGFASILSYGAALQGAARCHIDNVIVEGTNPNCPGIVAEAVRVESRTVGTETRHSTDNVVKGIVAKDITRALQEVNSSQARNRFEVVTVQNTTNTSIMLGTGSTLRRVNQSGVVEEIATSVSLAGAFMATNAANAVNYLATTAAAAGGTVGLSAAGTDTDINFAIIPQGNGVLFLGNSAGLEAARVTSVPGGVNAVQITGAATGNFVSVTARGVDANIPLRLAGKGTAGVGLADGGGTVRVNTSTSGVGFNGATPSKPTLAAAATDAASTQTLVNDIRAKLIALGLTN